MATTPIPLVWPDGRELKREVLQEEIAAPAYGSPRTIYSGHPAQGLDPARLAGLLLGAEQGDAMAYFELAEEMEEKDLHYLAVLGTRKRAVAQLPIEVEPAGDSTQEKDDAKLVEDWLDRDMLEHIVRVDAICVVNRAVDILNRNHFCAVVVKNSGAGITDVAKTLDGDSSTRKRKVDALGGFRTRHENTPPCRVTSP